MRQKANSQQNRPVPSKSKPALPPNLSEHNLPEPFIRLLMLGDGEFPDVYQAVAGEIKSGDTAKGVQRLIEMALDESYYDYYEFYASEAEYYKHEPRMYTRLHSVRTLAVLGEVAHSAISALMPLFDEEDDELREEMPFVYAVFGKAAVEPLAKTLMDREAVTYLRAGAGEALQEIAEQHPDLHPIVVPILEQALATETEDEVVAGFLVCNLLDVGAKESYPLIEKAFEEGRVDETIVALADVQEHFEMPVTAESGVWTRPVAPTLPATKAVEAEPKGEWQEPYVAPHTPGRNDPCWCGSGQKYKKCHGK